MRIPHRVRWAALILAAIFGAPFTGVAQQVRSNLRLSLSQIEQKSTHPLFRVEICNSGNQPLILKLGAIHGGRQYLNAIHLLLTEAHGKILNLEPLEGGIISGRIDPLIVPLPVGATFAFPVDLTDYVSIKEHVWELELVSGRYKLTARYVGTPVSQREANLDMQGLAVIPYWTGTVDSNTLPFFLTHTMRREHRE